MAMPCIVGGRKNLMVDDEDLGDTAASPQILQERAEFVKGMTIGQLFTFTKFLYPTKDLAMLIPVRRMNEFYKTSGESRINESYRNKHLAAATSDTPAAVHWRWFIDLVESLNVFSEIGRITVFLNERGQCTTPHRDYYSGVSQKDQFLFFPSPRKKFWVMVDGQKHPITSPVALFDNANFHGSEIPDYPVWSIRVDGVYTEEFLDRSYLRSHFAPQR